VIRSLYERARLYAPVIVEATDYRNCVRTMNSVAIGQLTTVADTSPQRLNQDPWRRWDRTDEHDRVPAEVLLRTV